MNRFESDMKNKLLFLLACLLLSSLPVFAQKPNPYINVFPKGTVIHENVPYNNDTDPRHLLDLYLPASAKGKVPLVIFVHGGGWISNDKYADMGYMKKTIAEIVSSGFALASIDYRLATQAAFPALIQDCNRAASFLYDNANKYGLDRTRFAVMGFSAGGHLASLMGLSKNNNVAAFFMPNTSKQFSFKAVVDFYGPSELTSLKSSDDPKAPEAVLIGAAPVARRELRQPRGHRLGRQRTGLAGGSDQPRPAHERQRLLPVRHARCQRDDEFREHPGRHAERGAHGQPAGHEGHHL